jgi:hypothetical protein
MSVCVCVCVCVGGCGCARVSTDFCHAPLAFNLGSSASSHVYVRVRMPHISHHLTQMPATR